VRTDLGDRPISSVTPDSPACARATSRVRDRLASRPRLDAVATPSGQDLVALKERNRSRWWTASPRRSKGTIDLGGPATALRMDPTAATPRAQCNGDSVRIVAIARRARSAIGVPRGGADLPLLGPDGGPRGAAGHRRPSSTPNRTANAHGFLEAADLWSLVRWNASARGKRARRARELYSDSDSARSRRHRRQRGPRAAAAGAAARSGGARSRTRPPSTEASRHRARRGSHAAPSAARSRFVRGPALGRPRENTCRVDHGGRTSCARVPGVSDRTPVIASCMDRSTRRRCRSRGKAHWPSLLGVRGCAVTLRMIRGRRNHVVEDEGYRTWTAARRSAAVVIGTNTITRASRARHRARRERAPSCCARRSRRRCRSLYALTAARTHSASPMSSARLR